MASPATSRKIKRSFTLSRDSVEFLHETRVRRRAQSDSEALDLLLQDARCQARLSQLDAEYKDYYDNATDEELQGRHEWAEMAGPSFLTDSPEASS